MNDAPRKVTPRSERTRAKLLSSAETLFARRGIEGTSLREIAAEAGLTNNVSVQYHFGSKANLLDELFHDRMMQMEASRGRMLEAAERRNDLNDLQSIIEIICLPHLDLVRAVGSYHYAEFLSQYVLRYRPPPTSLPTGNSHSPGPENLFRAQALLRACLPTLPDEVFERRLVVAVLAFLAVLIKQGPAARSRQDAENLSCALADTLRQVAVAMSLPFDPEARLPQ